MQDKTNVMRLLDSRKISYKVREYDPNETNGEHIAALLGEDTSRVFKTLVTVGKSNNNYVFVIPVKCELDLKKAAKSADEKSVTMLKNKLLLPLTGYIHGGCSPIGMKKFFPTFVDNAAQNYPTIFVSAGRVGKQIEIAPADLAKMIRLNFADLCVE